MLSQPLIPHRSSAPLYGPVVVLRKRLGLYDSSTFNSHLDANRTTCKHVHFPFRISITHHFSQRTGGADNNQLDITTTNFDPPFEHGADTDARDYDNSTRLQLASHWPCTCDRSSWASLHGKGRHLLKRIADPQSPRSSSICGLSHVQSCSGGLRPSFLPLPCSSSSQEE